MEEIKRGYQENRRILIEGLPRAGLTKFLPADGAFYLYADVSEFTADSFEFAGEMLEQAHVAATPGIDFDPVHGRQLHSVLLCAFGRGNARSGCAHRAMARIGDLPRIRSGALDPNAGKCAGAIDSADPIDFGWFRNRAVRAGSVGRIRRIRRGSETSWRQRSQPRHRPRAAKPWYKILYVQVLIAILLGVVVGWLWPDLATNDWIKALGDGFIKLIKMVIAPIIFCTVVSGISHIQDASKVGRVGVKALVYFEVVSSFALIIGLVDGQSDPGRSRAGREARRRGGRELRQAGGSAEVGRFRPQHHSRQRGRRAGARRHPAGAAVRHPVRLCADGARRARPPAARPHRRHLARGIRRDRHRHEGRAARRLRRDGLYHRKIRARGARQSDRTDRACSMRRRGCS